MKLPSSLKAILLFFLVFLSAYILFSKGITNDHIHLFNAGYRIPFIQECYKGLELSHQHLLSYRNEVPNYYPVENLGDDMGIYYFVPLIMHLFHSDTYLAYLYLFCTIVFISYCLSVIGISLLFENTYIKLFAYFYMAVFAFASLFILDNYIFAYFITSLIPLLYWLWKKHSEGDIKTIYLILALLATGLLAGIANQFRLYSGMGVILIVIAFIALQKNTSILRKLIFIGVLLSTLPLCKMYFNHEISQRDKWIEANGNCLPSSKMSGHITWHNIYLGLGIVDNKYGILWRDTVAFNKAKQYNPNLYNMTPEYISAIKNEYLSIVKNDLLFVLKTFVYKSFYILLFVIIFFNYGFSLIRKVKFNYRIFLPLLLGILFYILPALLTFPLPHYLLGALNILVLSELFLINEVYFKHKS